MLLGTEIYLQFPPKAHSFQHRVGSDSGNTQSQPTGALLPVLQLTLTAAGAVDEDLLYNIALTLVVAHGASLTCSLLCPLTLFYTLCRSKVILLLHEAHILCFSGCVMRILLSSLPAKPTKQSSDKGKPLLLVASLISQQ